MPGATTIPRNQRVTAREMVLLADHVIRTYPDLYKYFGEKDFTWNKIHQMNRNPLLTMDIGADGLKTGEIDAKPAMALSGSAVQNGQRLILALYGAKSTRSAPRKPEIIAMGLRLLRVAQPVCRQGCDRVGQGLWRRAGDVPLCRRRRSRFWCRADRITDSAARSSIRGR